MNKFIEQYHQFNYICEEFRHLKELENNFKSKELKEKMIKLIEIYVQFIGLSKNDIEYVMNIF